jgi:hypothetical protein
MSIIGSGIHIIYGENAGGSFKQAQHTSDRLLVQRDPLSCGPIINCANVQEWQQTRMCYLEKLFDYPGINFNNLKTDPLNNVNWVNDFDSIYVWAGTGLEDQLLILFVVNLVEWLGGNPEKINIVQYETFTFNGKLLPMYALGYLNPEQILAHPEPMPLTQSHIAYYRSGWAALTADTPLPLMQFIASAQPLNKYTAAALYYFFRRYPRSESGLDYWDTQLLIHADKLSRLAGKIMADTWQGDHGGDIVGDFYLLNKMRHLSSSELTEPLLKLSGAQTWTHDTYVAITEFGAAVLNGEISSYPTNPIDKWVGGVHLSSSTDNLWFYKDGQVVGINGI